MKLVSACLAGKNCGFDGASKSNARIVEMIKCGEAIAVCPEQLARFGTPREQTEIRNGKVFSKSGKDLTEQFEVGAQRVLEIAKANGCKKAILKARSPSCGSGMVYDGSFTGKTVKGDGVTAALLKRNGIIVKTEDCK